ncbi:MAG: hypothetical protein LBS55_11630 [Prevotellaceae bacterium]|jgi:4-amino-4-deoxy-L-arabinose transferase-like glycosyltransferase|nr:hypothetical protein [Prevotellaceae bacterium]
MIKNKNQVVFYAVSLFFIALNIFTLEWTPLPWVDEIMLVDTPVNFVLDGEWQTTACMGDKNNEIHITYPPLYQFALVIWTWLFGVSPTACRSLSVVLAFFISLLIYRFMRDKSIIKNHYTLLLFLLLFWCGGMFSWIYRNGRVDILNMLCTTAFITGYYYNVKKWFLALFAFLIITSGIQACPYVLGIFICIYFFQSNKKRTKTAIFMLIAGSLSGLLFMSVLFYLQGHLFAFYYRNFFFSGSFNNIISLLIPYIEKVIALDPAIKEALNKPAILTTAPFFQRVLDAYVVNREYLILSAINIIVYSGLLIKRKIIFNSLETRLLFITIVIPLIMAVAGRFAGYYTWMCYIPAVVFMIYVVGKYGKQICISAAYGLTTLLVVSLGLPKTLINSDRDAYHKIKTFIQKQDFSDKDKIISPFMSYYVIRNITKTCYFTGVYPLALVPDDTKYILKAENDYGNENMDKYIQYCEFEGKTVHPVDSLESPKMVLFLVE